MRARAGKAGRAGTAGRTGTILLALAAFVVPVSAQDGTGTIRGVVLETRDGAPMAKVLVRLQDTRRSVTTDDAGQFELSDVSPGSHELYVSVVDFILVKRTLTVAAGATTDVTIVLAEGTGTFEQSVTVTGRLEDAPDGDAPSAQLLKAKELQQLRGLVTNDPLRAIQVLPGVATGDDLKSEFTVRGHAIDHMVFTFEGIATPLLVHTVQRIVDTGSLAMINGDVLDEVSLVGGAYPERHGDRLGAELDFHMREGSRQRAQARLSVSGTDAALVTEGPIGSDGRGSWLTSIRKSYLDLVTSRLDTPVDFTFGFTDTQAKVVYDVNAANQLQFALAAGRSRLNLDPNDIDPGDPKDGRNASAFGVLSWRRIFSPRTVLVQRVAVGANEYRNTSSIGVELARGVGRDGVYRADWTWAARPHLSFEGGGELRASAQSRNDVAIVSPTRFVERERFDRSAVASSAFVHVQIGGARWRVTPGVRIDHSTLVAGTSASPWAQGSYALSSRLTLRAGVSVAHQRPTFDQLVGLRGTPSLDTETAYHTELGLEGPIAAGWRWRATAFDREERDIIRLPIKEYRTFGTVLQLPSTTTRYRNSLKGHARGVDLTVERRSANGLSGWASYTYGVSRYRDVLSGEAFWGDYDQRHTMNAYGLYRFSERFSTSGRFRAGSNFPTPGYWEERNGRYFVGSVRNELRVPTYARLDLRINRTFAKRHTRLTLFVEVLNALGRENVRYAVPGVNRQTFEALGLYDPLFPRVPSAGLLVEF